MRYHIKTADSKKSTGARYSLWYSEVRPDYDKELWQVQRVYVIVCTALYRGDRIITNVFTYESEEDAERMFNKFVG